MTAGTEGATPSSPQPVEIQLAVISTKLDYLIVQRSDHETRIRALEKFRWVLAGFVMAGGGTAGGVVAKLLS